MSLNFKITLKDAIKSPYFYKYQEGNFIAAMTSSS